MEEQAGTNGMALAVAPASHGPWKVAGALVAAGVVGMFVLSFLEARWIRNQPWGTAVRTEDYLIDDPAAIESWSRELSLEQSVGDSEWVKIIQMDLARMAATAPKPGEPEPKPDSAAAALFDTEQYLDLSFFPKAWLVMVDIPAAEMAPLLESGRLPEPGKFEILAGPLLSSRDLVLDGQRFTVVGRLRPASPGFVKAYVVPADAAVRGFFSEDKGAKRGSMVIETAGRLEALIPELFDRAVKTPPVVHGRPVQTRSFIAWGVWLCLLAAASGASMGFIAIFRRLAQTRVPLLAEAMRETVLRPGLLWGLHLFLFGAFFGAMAFGMQDPELNHVFTEYASHTFTDGGLKYVGDAYDSGNIPRAAHATFHNNFVVQTLKLTCGLAFIPPFFLGVVKTLASFVVVGFAMAPIWTDTASGMTYHSVTLVLELPPYILAAFGVSVWSLCLLELIWSPVRVWYLGDKAAGETVIQDAAAQVPRGLATLAGCTLLSGLFLYAAAWYEAVTLILLR